MLSRRLTSRLTGAARSFSSAANARFEPLAKHRLHPSLAHPLTKRWQAEPIAPANIMYPIFVTDVDNAKQEIKTLPGQYRWSVDKLDELIAPLVDKGLRSVLIFGVLDKHAKQKDPHATFATSKDSPVTRALAKLQKNYPHLFLATDLCLCAYTSHGHCGIVKQDGTIDNPPSIARLADIALSYARAGAHCIAPSDMMDGRVGAIKQVLQQNGFGGSVSLMSYSAKFASCLYGPFRDAASSGAQFGDRSRYQLHPPARGLALRAVQRDIEEGADIVMVKPGSAYLDILRDTKNAVNVPVAVYHTSGEFAMLHHGAAAGAFALEDGVLEQMQAFRRAGADILITYYAPQILDWLATKGSKFDAQR